MEHELNNIYQLIKNGKINDNEAINFLKEYKEHNCNNILKKIEEFGIEPDIYSYNEPYLRDHLIDGKRILPGVTYASISINAFFKMFPEEKKVKLQKLNFINQVEAAEGKKLMIICSPEFSDSQINFDIKYGNEKSQNWKTASRVIAGKDKFEARKTNVKKIKDRLECVNEIHEIYKLYVNNEWGNSFRNIDELYAGKDEALAKINGRVDITNADHKYIIHPEVFNSINIIANYLMKENNIKGDFIPIGINEILFDRKSNLEKCWIHVRFVKKSDEIMLFDGSIISYNGKISVRCLGFALKRINSDIQSIKKLEKNNHPDSIIKIAEKNNAENIYEYLVGKINSCTGIEIEGSSVNINFMDMGINSSQLVLLSNEIEHDIEIRLYPTVFFEYVSVVELEEYFSREYKKEFTNYFNKNSNMKNISNSNINDVNATMEKNGDKDNEKKNPHLKTGHIIYPDNPFKKSISNDVAIIGINGKFPNSKNIYEFWDIIKNKTDVIKEIPMDHWDYKPWFDADKNSKNTTYCKWGSFLDDIDKFDAGFFHISPREADWMDPQLRLLLESIYSTGEDAGYMKELKGTSTGVFVGICCHDYMDRIIQMGYPVDPYIQTGNSQAVIANRVSFIFNFKGPSFAIDTGCSSSLFAVHQACNALKNKECELAFASGVNLLLSSWHYRYFSSIGALSQTGRCHSFDERADGYVPGECIASMLLKPLDQAIKDNDNIYAVIKGSATVHGGYTPSLTAPSVEGEESVMIKAWKNAGINPENITYIEAHGTGTKLGDPVEINAIKRSFEKFTSKKHFCAIGTVKSNIGHTEGAAGIAGIIKTILQMKNKKIPAMQTFDKINPYINIDESALYINKEMIDWNSNEDVPLIAGINSFGFSGSYAHVVIQEYVKKNSTSGIPPENKIPIILSAANDKMLIDQCKNLLEHINKFNLSDNDINNMAMTLQLGREEMKYRIAINVNTIDDLIDRLTRYLDNEENIEDLFVNQSIKKTDDKSNEPDLNNVEDGILDSWVNGAKVDWTKYYKYVKPGRISLPSYPFNGGRYWIPEVCSKHSILLEDISDQNGMKYAASIDGNEFFISDHVVNGKKILPGAMYLEIALAAVKSVENKNNSKRYKISNVIWIRTFEIENIQRRIYIDLLKDESGIYSFEIHSHKDEHSSEKIINCRGRVIIDALENKPDIKTKKTENDPGYIDIPVEEFYSFFNKMGIEYGNSFRGLKKISVCNDSVFAKIMLPEVLLNTFDQYVLHPVLIDSAIQAIAGLNINNENNRPSIVFSLDEMTINGKCSPEMRIFARRSDDIINNVEKYDIDMFDDEGNIKVLIKGLTANAIGKTKSDKRTEIPAEDIYFIPVWNAVNRIKCKNVIAHNGTILLISHDDYFISKIKDIYPAIKVLNFNYTETIDEICERIGLYEDIGQIIWDVCNNSMETTDNDTILDEQKYGVLFYFRLLKVFFKLDYADRKLYWNIITRKAINIHSGEKFNPSHSSLMGLEGVVAKEYPEWKIRHIDIEKKEDIDIVKYNLNEEIDELMTAFRSNQWFKRDLYRCNLPVNDNKIYKNGIYVILGGSGGIGYVLSEYLITKYDARVVWIGRRKKDESIMSKLNDISKLGKMPLYISADAVQYDDLKKAYEKIMSQFSKIDGIFHSIAGILDNSLIKMNETDFISCLQAKINTSINMEKVFGCCDPDFISFFSSTVAFTCDHGKGGYSAGCNFIDNYAHYLSNERKYPIKVMNWGYWNVGIGKDIPQSAKNFIRQIGLEALDPGEAMNSLRSLLNSNINQMAMVRMRNTFNIEGIDSCEHINILPDGISSVIAGIADINDITDINKNEELEKMISERERWYREFDSMLCGLLRFQFQSMNLTEGDNLHINYERVIPDYIEWIETTLSFFIDRSYLKKTNDEYIFSDSLQINKDLIWSQWDDFKNIQAAIPDRKNELILIDAIIRKLPEILTGKIPATDIIFPDSSMKLVEGIYKENMISDYYNGIISDMMSEYMRERILRDNKKISIIELGAGTGSCTSPVLEKINVFKNNIDIYCFTDLSKSFLMNAEKNYGINHQFLKYKILDVEKPVTDQGFEEGSYDVVIASNVLHATADIHRTMRTVKALMKNGGIILLNEICSNSLFLHLTFGLLKGWWLYDDHQLRIKGCPGIKGEIWEKILDDEGFVNIKFPALHCNDLGQQIIMAESNGVIRIKSDCDRTEKFIQDKPAIENKRTMILDGDNLKKRAINYMQSIIGKALKLPESQLDPDENLEIYGIDSIVSVQLVNTLKKSFDNVSSTLFFEYPNISSLAEYFSKSHRDKMIELAGIDNKNTKDRITDNKDTLFSLNESNPNHKKDDECEVSRRNNNDENSIAIIGISGRFPGANSLEEYWENLKSGKVTISEIPADRWRIDGFYNNDVNESVLKGKSCCKMGGFLDNINEFDPLFFQMSPNDAEQIDPQERIFLEECWKALEDSGYKQSSFSSGFRERVGVFGGITKQGYSLHGNPENAYRYTTSFASMVNRVSYYLDLNGPSVPVDAMCSSSLTAIHEACEYLRSKKGDMAIAGGVNLYLHPSNYIYLSKNKLLSDSSNCAAFGGNSTGFIPGECAGAVILKRYDQAIADNDDIYAVIKGSSVNHNGKTNGYGMPNPKSLVKLINKALINGGIEPGTITYIESAANGSLLGDAAETNALSEVFGYRENTGGYYKIGSVKPNIGHCESSSGISQLFKVIFSLKNKLLAPTIVTGELNPSINFEKLPFTLQRDLSEWKRLKKNDEEIPRRAGITGIGAGGVNAHLIIEENCNENSNDYDNGNDVLFILSAKTEESLKEYTNDWIEFLKLHVIDDMERLAYTMQTGREFMNLRLAIVVNNVCDLLSELESWSKKNENTERCYFGNLKNSKMILSVNFTGSNFNIHDMAKLWILGNNIDWDEIYNGKKIKKMSGLPTYPFVRKKCLLKNIMNEDPTHSRNMEQHANKAVELYSYAAKNREEIYKEEYITFCPFMEKIDGFSMSRVMLNPEKYGNEYNFIIERQRELRQVLFFKEDFNKINNVFDFGCGHGTDVIQIAHLYSHIKTRGYTITPAQAELGNKRIASMNLNDRATIFNKDSSCDVFPDNNDLIIGIEVSFHIKDKEGLFQNIESSLADNGRVLLIDYAANLRGRIEDDDVEVSIMTSDDWIEILSKHHLAADEIIDVSPWISNFLHDPDIEGNIKDLPEVVSKSYRNFVNQSKSLDKGWISYCIFKLNKKTEMSFLELYEYNKEKINNKNSYIDAVNMMKCNGFIPYPRNNESESGIDMNKMRGKTNENNINEIKSEIVDILIKVLGLSDHDIRETGVFKDLGVGSMNTVELTEGINRKFGINLPTSVIFNFYDIEGLSGYINSYLKEHGLKYFNDEIKPKMFVAEKRNDDSISTDSIAIVGLSCRCSGANDQDEFWEMISNGKNSIGEIKDKEWIDYFNEYSSKNKTFRYGKMSDIEYFDSLFFSISPKEAEMMDIEQRIILEECYKAIEDAGYAPSSLKGKSVGTIVGTMGNHQMGRDFSHFSMTGIDSSILAARIAYFLDLKGPSISINTACSSSLVAIDIACQKLKSREIDMAIAGGITVYSHPGEFITMNNAGMLSLTGECRPFDHFADGIVAGDGAGIVILKRLKDAISDNDNIYGVIKAIGTNQDGQTSGITVPSFISQSRLEEGIYRKYGINVDDIQYIEAHGTATKLGDPIELHALTDSFRKFTDKKRFCGIGSLKANIGHTAAAAGILGLIKVLLGLKYKKIPPSINFKKENEHIDFAESPFYVNASLKEWNAGNNGKRIAAVSSFGFSGTNAHLVVEDYPDNKRISSGQKGYPGDYIIIFSSKNKSRLMEQIKKFVSKIKKGYYGDDDLSNISYTLQVGRDPMEERIAFCSSSLNDVVSKLEMFIDGKPDISGFYQNNVEEKTKYVLPVRNNEDYLNDELFNKRNHKKIIELWISGYPVDWNRLYKNRNGKISLPAHIFSKQHFDVSFVKFEHIKKTESFDLENISDFKEYKFKVKFNSGDFFIKDHIVNDKFMLPGVVHLELARTAGHSLSKKNITKIYDIVWAHPVVEIEHDFFVRLQGEKESIKFEIFSDDNIHSQGRMSLIREKNKDRILIMDIIQRCDRSMDDAQCYEIFEKSGLKYGQSFQGIKVLHYNEREAIAELKDVLSICNDNNKYILHPSIMDSALQSIMGLTLTDNNSGKGKLYLPFSIEEIIIYGDTSNCVYAYARKRSFKKADDDGIGNSFFKFDVDLTDGNGNIIISIKEFNMRLLKEDAGKDEIFYAIPEWIDGKIINDRIDCMDFYSIFLMVIDDKTIEKIKKEIQGASINILHNRNDDLSKNLKDYYKIIFEHIKNIMMKNDIIHHYIIIVIPNSAAGQLYSYVSGLLKTANMENPDIFGKIILIDPDENDIPGIVINEMSIGSFSDCGIRYVNGNNREVKILTEIKINNGKDDSYLKEGGVYLITGGMGGIGRILAGNIGKMAGTNVILCGRSSHDKITDFIKSSGQNVEYMQCDITDKEQVTGLVEKIRSRFGKISGIVHCAGVLNDSYISNKTIEKIDEVLNPKIDGLINIDNATLNDRLEFLVMFSSVSGVTGNIGQCDYSSANAFMDEFAHYRQTLVNQGKRFGRTVSINWPLWKDGGMKIDGELLKVKFGNLGMSELDSIRGIDIFKTILNGDFNQVLTVFGNIKKIKDVIINKKKPYSDHYHDIDDKKDAGESGFDSHKISGQNKNVFPDETSQLTADRSENEEYDNEELKDAVVKYLKDIICNTLKIKKEELSADKGLDKYGLDSIIVLEIGNKLEEKFKGLSKTLFFEYNTINGISDYFVKRHRNTVINSLLNVKKKALTGNHEFSLSRKNGHDLNAKHIKENECTDHSSKDDEPSSSNNRHTIDIDGYLLAEIERGNINIDDILRLSNIKINSSYNIPEKENTKNADFSNIINPTNIFIHETELNKRPDLKKIINDIDMKHPPVGYIRLLYKYIFISFDKTGYVRLIYDEDNKLLIPIMPIKEFIYEELSEFSIKNKFNLLIVDRYHEWMNKNDLKLIPLGVIQDLDINDLSLKGRKMRKLGYLYEKFNKSGDVKTIEYDKIQELPESEMKEIIIGWIQNKKNIINPSYLCMMDLLNGSLPSNCRAFLTFKNKRLCSIIVIERTEDGAYLMDQEFYDPLTAPPGHMEYAIVSIINLLKEENAKIFSLGLTWHPFIFDSYFPKDENGYKWLKEQNEKQTFLTSIFNQGKSNYQFKKKFGVDGYPVFAYLPHNAPYQLILNYWASFHLNSIDSNQLKGIINDFKPESNVKRNDKNEISENKFDNEEIIDNPLDLRTDTWFKVRNRYINDRIDYLRILNRAPDYDDIRKIFPFKNIILTKQGRIAELLFYLSYSKKIKKRKRIITAIPWTTTLMHQLNNGFDVVEIPVSSVFDIDSNELYKGEIDIDRLKKEIENDPDNIAFIGIEVLSNGTGGHPVRVEHLININEIIKKHDIPLVMDASRVVRNSKLLIKNDKNCRSKDLWKIVSDTVMQADYIVASLTKDFAVTTGGIIATNDDELAGNIREIQSNLKHNLNNDEEKIIINALTECDVIDELISDQMDFTQRLYNMLLNHNVPVLKPSFAHAIVIDVSNYIEGESNNEKKEKFIDLLSRETGIITGKHQSGKQRNTLLDKCIRIAIPIGMMKEDCKIIFEKLNDFFKEKKSDGVKFNG